MSAPYYQDEFVTLYHGDFREAFWEPAVTALLGDARVVIADPPYGETTLAWDRWPDGWLTSLTSLIPERASLWCFGSMRMFLDRRDEFSGWQFSQEIVWEKHNGSNSAATRFRRVHEFATHWYRGPWASVYAAPVYTNDATKRTVRRKEKPTQWGAIAGHTYTSEDCGPRLQRSVIYARSEHGRADNETQKPLAIVRPLIEHSCPEGATVISPFAGAGTDLLAAKLLGRRAVGAEVREAQCEKAALRLSQNILDFGGAA